MSKPVNHYFDAWKEVGKDGKLWSVAGPRCRNQRATRCSNKWIGVTCKRCLEFKGKKTRVIQGDSVE